MKRTFAAIAVASVATLVGGCAADDKPVAVQTITETVEATTTAAAAAKTTSSASSASSVDEKFYLMVLEQKSVPTVTDALSIELGKAVCGMVEAGSTLARVGAKIVSSSDGMYTLNNAAVIVGAAVPTFCPEFNDLIDG